MDDEDNGDELAPPPPPSNDGEYINDQYMLLKILTHEGTMRQFDDVFMAIKVECEKGGHQLAHVHPILNQVLTNFHCIHVEGLTSSLHLNTSLNAIMKMFLIL